MPSASFIEYTPRRPSNIEAIQITTENIDDVAKLIGGRVERLSKTSDPSDVYVSLVVPHLESPFRVELGWYLTRNQFDGTYGKEAPLAFETGWVPNFTSIKVQRYPDDGLRLVTSVEERTNRG